MGLTVKCLDLQMRSFRFKTLSGRRLICLTGVMFYPSNYQRLVFSKRLGSFQFSHPLHVTCFYTDVTFYSMDGHCTKIKDEVRTSTVALFHLPKHHCASACYSRLRRYINETWQQGGGGGGYPSMTVSDLTRID